MRYDKIVVSYHGVDLDRFRPAAREPSPNFRILTVGTLRECKGLPDLIEACRLLGGRGVPVDCTIVGDGPDWRPLERLIRRAGLADRMRITGFLDPLFRWATDSFASVSRPHGTSGAELTAIKEAGECQLNR